MRHSALLYKDQDQLLDGVLPFLQAGSERGEALLVAMPSANLEVVREVLEAEARLVSFMNLDQTGGNPARLISAWQEFGETDSGARGLRCVSEALWFGRSAAEIEECERHEMLLNVAFGASADTSVLCPYDRGRLDAAVLDRVAHSHRELTQDGNGPTASTSFVEPGDFNPFEGELPPVTTAIAEMPFRKSRLAELRALLRQRGDEAGLEGTRRGDFVLAGDELATNSIQHAGGGGTMRVWADEEQLFCEVRDDGRLEEPLIGRRRPPPEQAGGRGLWLVNQLCDLVQIRSGEDGNVIRLSMKLDSLG